MYDLLAVTNLIGIESILMSIVHTLLVCSIACFTASPLAVWIISVLFLLSFNLTFTRDLLVCDIFAHLFLNHKL